MPTILSSFFPEQVRFCGLCWWRLPKPGGLELLAPRDVVTGVPVTFALLPELTSLLDWTNEKPRSRPEANQ